LYLVAYAIYGVAMNNALSPSYHGDRWLEAGFFIQLALGLVAVVLLIAGLRQPARRRAAAICAWLILPVAAGVNALFITLGRP
jgi:hypothetical protein